MPKLRIFDVAKMSFNAIRDNKFLEKISEYTVLFVQLMFNMVKHTHLAFARDTSI